jgi:hypothetical protein
VRLNLDGTRSISRSTGVEAPLLERAPNAKLHSLILYITIWRQRYVALRVLGLTPDIANLS